ncbi:MAG: hypothetical protein IT249_20980 [Chitinophagaceae bacterium]|nr:hypothetical protein [Chitinophagaceae bacterium]
MDRLKSKEKCYVTEKLCLLKPSELAPVTAALMEKMNSATFSEEYIRVINDSEMLF